MTLTTSTYYRLAVGLALMTVLFLVGSIGALGIIGEGGAPDLMYGVVLVVLVGGTVLARLRARGMARVLVATALAQAAVGAVAVVAVAAGLGEFAGASIIDVVGINAMFTALFAVAAWLFQRAGGAARRASTSAAPNP